MTGSTSPSVDQLPPGDCLHVSAVTTTPETRCAFTDQTESTLSSLRSSMAGLFRHVPGGLRKARDVEKLLGIDAKLSWQLFKLVTQSNTLAIIPHIPSAPSIKRLLNAAATHGINPSAIDNVRTSYAAFENLVDVHAGERVTFDAMTRDLIDDDESFQSDLQHRKAMFIGYRHFYGAQTDTHLSTLIIHPSADGDFDYAFLRCKFGNQWMRKDAELIADMSRIYPKTDKPDALLENALLPDEAKQYGVPIIAQFCSQPLPALITTHSEDGQVKTVVTGDKVGKLGSTDLVFGYLWRKVPLRAFAHFPGIGFGISGRMNHPTRLFYTDVFVHRQSFPKLSEHFGIYGHTSLTEDPAKIVQTRPALPFREKPARLGRGLNNIYVPEVPIYEELIQTVCARMKWNADEFDVYRIRIEYPMLDSMVLYRFTVDS